MRRGRQYWRIRCVVTGLGALGLVTLSACEVESTPETELIAEDTSPAVAYTVRLDSERSDPGDFQLVIGGEGLRILTGPAGIAYRPEDTVTNGAFHAEASFTQFSAPVGYREAYGIFVGGRELEAPDQEYTYLLVRGTGDFLIKRRLGDITEVIVDWTSHDAVARVSEDGNEPTNVLAVEVDGDEARFLVNEVVVHAMPAAQARPYGVAGLRANHRLDVAVNAWSVTASQEPATQDGAAPGA